MDDLTDSWCAWNANTHGDHVTNQGECSQAASAGGVTYDAISQNSDTLPTGCYYEDRGKHVFWNVCDPCKPQDKWILTTGLKVVCSASTPSQVISPTASPTPTVRKKNKVNAYDIRLSVRQECANM